MPEEGQFVIPDLQRIGKYDVLERIADGGFATLYRGRDPFLKRLVAIKVCVSDDAELRRAYVKFKKKLLAQGISDSVDYAVAKGEFIRQCLGH